MRNLLFLLFFAGISATLNAQNTIPAERVAPVVTPAEMAAKQFDYCFSGLQTALKTGDAASINHFYGELMMQLRMAIQQAEDGRNAQEQPFLSRQKAILTAFEGFEFLKSTTTTAAPKLELLSEFGAMLKSK